MLVLVVDDSRTIRMMLGHALKQMGASEVVEADSAERAETLLRICDNVGLILTDWHMPGMSGLDFVTRLRAQPRFKTLPVIMATSEAAGDNVVAALRAGATNYIIKPFNEQQLREKVAPYLKTAGSSISSDGLTACQTGTLIDGDLGHLLQYLMQSGRSGACELICNDGRAFVYFEAGRIVGAKFNELLGEAAFYACFSTNMKRFRFQQELVEMPSGCSIALNTTALLLEAAARLDTDSRSIHSQ